MAATDKPIETTPKRRIKKRLFIPLLLLLLVPIGLMGLYVRGNWADSVERNPTDAGQKVVGQLYRTPEGRTVIRASVIVAAPPRETWPVVIDYNNQARFLPYVKALQGTPDDKGNVHLTGIAHSRLWGDWPFASDVRHEEKPDRREYAATWDSGGEEITVNRGSWKVTPIGEDRALVVYTLDIELGNHPLFAVRNVILDRLPSVVDAMRVEVERRQSAQGSRR